MDDCTVDREVAWSRGGGRPSGEGMRWLAGSLCYLSGAGTLLSVPDRRLGDRTSRTVHQHCTSLRSSRRSPRPAPNRRMEARGDLPVWFRPGEPTSSGFFVCCGLLGGLGRVDDRCGSLATGARLRALGSVDSSRTLMIPTEKTIDAESSGRRPSGTFRRCCRVIAVMATTREFGKGFTRQPQISLRQ
jgi:hypothetical protein